MRLLHDEHLSPVIAQRLRTRGHDVHAVKDRDDLSGQSDSVVFAAAVAEGRAVVTADLKDHRPLLRRAVRAGAPAFGLICLRTPTGGGSRARFQAIVDALDLLLTSHPGDRDLMDLGGERWLSVD